MLDSSAGMCSASIPTYHHPPCLLLQRQQYHRQQTAVSNGHMISCPSPCHLALLCTTTQIREHQTTDSRIATPSPLQERPLILLLLLHLLTTTWGMGLQLCSRTATIITIYGLWHKWNCENGIATVGDSRNPFFDSTGLSIVWATVPAWIISAYSSLWSAVLGAFEKLHPMMELDKANQVRLPSAESREASWSRLWQRLPLLGVSPGYPPPPPPTVCSTAKRTLLLDYGE